MAKEIFAKFELNGVVYTQKDAKGTYCYKGGQRIPYKVFLERYEEYKQTDAYKAEQATKAEKPAKIKKTSKPRTKAAFEQEVMEVQVRLTEKQVDFIKHMSDTCFWEHGLDSTPWIDILAEEIGGQFANNPYLVGAMVSTLREKGLISVGADKVNGRKCKFFALTEVGKEVAKELGLE